MAWYPEFSPSSPPSADAASRASVSASGSAVAADEDDLLRCNESIRLWSEVDDSSSVARLSSQTDGNATQTGSSSPSVLEDAQLLASVSRIARDEVVKGGGSQGNIPSRKRSSRDISSSFAPTSRGHTIRPRTSFKGEGGETTEHHGSQTATLPFQQHQEQQHRLGSCGNNDQVRTSQEEDLSTPRHHATFTIRGSWARRDCPPQSSLVANHVPSSVVQGSETPQLLEGEKKTKNVTVLRRKFSWKSYPELEAFLIANREEYLRHSKLNYTVEQKQFNNKLTERLLEVAAEHGYAFDEEVFSFVGVRDRIRCYFKSYVQSSKKRGVAIRGQQQQHTGRGGIDPPSVSGNDGSLKT